jgi:hypothetical protein
MNAGVVAGALRPAPDPSIVFVIYMSLNRAPAKRRPPFGFRRREVICVVIAPRRCSRIAVVALPRI